MSRVFVDLGISLDGFVAGPNRGPGNPLGDGGLAIHDWMFATATFRERLCGDPGDGERGLDDDVLAQGFARSGAYVIGRRMFDEGEVCWPEDAPFRAPVFVVTRHARAPWVRNGGTIFHFVTDGLLAALTRAREAAGARDVRIGGGADLVQQAFAAGVVDELTLHVVPLLLGRGLRLFDGVATGDLVLEPNGAAASPRVQHLHYRVRRAAG